MQARLPEASCYHINNTAKKDKDHQFKTHEQVKTLSSHLFDHSRVLLTKRTKERTAKYQEDCTIDRLLHVARQMEGGTAAMTPVELHPTRNVRQTPCSTVESHTKNIIIIVIIIIIITPVLYLVKKSIVNSLLCTMQDTCA